MKTEHGEFNEIRNPVTGEIIITAEEHYEVYLKQLEDKQIDNCSTENGKTLEEQVKDLQKEKEQLWETVQFLLKKTGMIGGE